MRAGSRGPFITITSASLNVCSSSAHDVVMVPQPCARRFHSMASHSRRFAGATQRICVLFGGCHGKSYSNLNDVWLLAEVCAACGGLPPGFPLSSTRAQWVHSQTTRYRTQIPGYRRRHKGTGLGLSHEWHRLATTGRSPQSRWGHSASFVGDTMAVFGGRRGSDCNELHLLTLSMYIHTVILVGK